jgi:arylsulfatase/arylsulfatase A
MFRFLSIVLLALCLPHTFVASDERPNVIVVITDDQGLGDFGFMGNDLIETPHFDAMAGRSARLTRFYVNPVCAPTRASLMTGRYNYRTRAHDTFTGRAMMEPEEVTIAEILKKAGYSTGQFGKWHLGDHYPMRPSDQGFDESLRHFGGGIGQPSDPEEAERQYTNPILYKNDKKTQMEGYCTDLYFDAALDFIKTKSKKRKPFFAYIATNAPHGPFHDVPKDWYDHYKKRDLSPILQESVSNRSDARRLDTTARIFAMISNVDDNMGRLFTTLHDLKLEENTIVVFMNDNGPNGPRYVQGLRGQKGQVFEGGIRSPFWVQWKGMLEPGDASNRMAAHIDVLPTVLELCNVDAPEHVPLDGRSVVPLLERDERGWRDRTLFFQWNRADIPEPRRKFAAVSERWKIVQPKDSTLPGVKGIALYDLQNDPYETTDVANQNPDPFNGLLASYDRWFRDVSATRPDNYAPPRIPIGTRQQKEVILSRQDWRNAKGYQGWGKNSLGYWMVTIVKTSRYSVRVSFEPDDQVDGVLTLRCAGQEWAIDIPASSERRVYHEMKGVKLDSGDTQFEAEFTPKGMKTRGVHQVIISS